MNLRMMYYGKVMATDGTPENDMMTRQAINFMESQIEDPELREKVRPYSKCTQEHTFLQWPAGASSMLTQHLRLL